MSNPLGLIVERLTGAQIYFAPDGSTIGATSQPIAYNVVPATPAIAMMDYTLGRVQSAKYVPEFKEFKREYRAATGGYRQKTDKRILAEGFEFSMIDYATQLFDQIAYGTAELAAPGAAVLPFGKSLRQVDGWAYAKILNDTDVVIALLLIHCRLTITDYPEFKNEPGTPKFHIAHLCDGGALDQITFTADHS